MSQRHQGRQWPPQGALEFGLSASSPPCERHHRAARPNFLGPTAGAEELQSARFHLRRGHLFGTIRRGKSSRHALLVAMKIINCLMSINNKLTNLYSVNIPWLERKKTNHLARFLLREAPCSLRTFRSAPQFPALSSHRRPPERDRPGGARDLCRPRCPWGTAAAGPSVRRVGGVKG